MMIPSKHSHDPKSVLLIGSAAPNPQIGRHSDAVRILRLDTVPQAIAALRRENFEKVCVSLSALRTHPEPALIGLRQAAPAARIVLLVQMLEEPLVVDLMRQTRLARSLFDDYLVCPVQWEQLVNNAPRAIAPLTSEVADTDIARHIEELEKLVIQDDLTGLKNRRYLRQFLPQILRLAEEQHLRVTLLLFDIDDFKHYNDAYGHTVGDNVLRQAGCMIQKCCRNHDVVARLGGDEFVVVFWDLPGEKHDPSSPRDRRNAVLEHPRQPIFMAERFCKELSQAAFEYIGPKGKGALTISGGLATFPTDAKNPEELFEKADMAMLEAKRSGKNRIFLVGQPA